MNIAGFSRAAVLAALYNRARPQGMGFMHYEPTPMTEAQATEILKTTTSFDYIKGRVMKIDLKKDEVDTWGFNRDNGENAAEEVLAILRKTGETHNTEIQRKHGKSTLQAAGEADRAMDEESSMEVKGGIATMHLGLSDMKDHLQPKIDEVRRNRN